MSENKRPSVFSLGRELSKSEQKKILGGEIGNCPGYKCDGSPMSCTTSPINVAYCQAVWHTSIVDNCTVVNC